MTKERLEFHLEKGTMFGYNIPASNDNIGWVLLTKRFPAKRFFDLVSEKESPEAYKEQLRIKNEPYNIRVAEINKAAFESDRSPDNEEYLINVNYSFPTLDDAEEFLKQMGLSLSDIKWTSEIEFL